MTSLTGTFAAWSAPVVYGQEAPSTTSPFLNRLISSEATPQYFLPGGLCFFSSAIAASNWVLFSSYGSVMWRARFVLDRYRAASAVWIGVFGAALLPLYFGS